MSKPEAKSDELTNPAAPGEAAEPAEISIVAVAKRAGVSIATVSRVLNDIPVVNQKTVEAVRRAVEEMGYRPLRIRRNGKDKGRRAKMPQLRGNQIAVVAIGGGQGWFTMPVMASVLSGITRGARECDIRLMLEELPADRITWPAARFREMAGAIAFVQPMVEEKMLAELASKIPLVWAMGGETFRGIVDHVSADNIGIGYAAYDFLVRNGCDHFMYITNTPEWPLMRARGQAFANAARDAKKNVSSFIATTHLQYATAYGPGTVVTKSLEDAVDRLVAARTPTSGLFIPTDLLTTLIYPMLIQRGVKPCEDLKIISCDNEEVRLSQLTPRPPSIDLAAEDIGRAAVRQLIMRISNPAAPIVRVQVSPRMDDADSRGSTN